jgi:Adenomatosis polyposis coli down-regulated 1
MKYLMIKVLATALLLAAATLNAQPAHPLQKQIKGTWVSAAAEDLGNGTFGTRYFKLKKDQWEIRFTLYLDAAAQQPVFTFRAVGSYDVQGPSKVVAGASNAVFHFSKKYLTLETDDAALLQNFGFAGLGFVKGNEQDISASGASFLPSVAAYGQEYDLLKLDQGQLFFGMRSNDMSSEDKRPTALFYPLNRR